MVDKTSKILWGVAALLVLFTGYFYLSNPSNFSTPSDDQIAEEVKAPENIECYLDGKRVLTTRENCAELSKKKETPTPVVNVQQPRPQIQIPVPQLPTPPDYYQTSQPKIEKTTCRQFTDGSVHCQTTQF